MSPRVGCGTRREDALQAAPELPLVHRPETFLVASKKIPEQVAAAVLDDFLRLNGDTHDCDSIVDRSDFDSSVSAMPDEPREDLPFWLENWCILLRGLYVNVHKPPSRTFDLLPQWAFSECHAIADAGDAKRNSVTSFAGNLGEEGSHKSAPLLDSATQVTFDDQPRNFWSAWSERICCCTLLSRFVLGPNNRFRMFWIGLGLIFLVWDALTVPLQVFDMGEFDPFARWLSTSIIAYWMVDIVIQFFCAYRNDDGLIIWSLEQIRLAYVKSYFIQDILVVSIDVVISLLIDWDVFALGDPDAGGASAQAGALSMRLTRLSRLARLVRLLRARRLRDLFRSVLDRIGSEYILLAANFFKYAVLIFLTNHYIACAWYSLTLLAAPGEQTWITYFEAENQPWGMLYTLSLHWSVTQFSPSTQNLHPTNSAERVFACVTSLTAILVFSSLVSGVTNAVNQIRMCNMGTMMEQSRLREFMMHAGVSTDLFARVLNFYKGSYQKRVIKIQEQDLGVLLHLPESMMIEMHVQLYSRRLTVLPSMKALEDSNMSFIKRICHVAMHNVVYLPHQDAFIDGNTCHTLRMILSGKAVYETMMTCDRFVPTRTSVNDTEKQLPVPIHSSAVADIDFNMSVSFLRRLRVKELRWLSEMALWIHWKHVGRMSMTTNSEVVVLNKDKVTEVVELHAGSYVRRTLRVCAILACALAERMEDMQTPVTDMPLHEDDNREVVERALRFTSMSTAYGLLPKVSKMA